MAAPPSPPVAPNPVSGYGCNDTVCVHLADTTIAVICDIKVAGTVYSDAPGVIQRSFDGKAVIASITGGAITGHGCNDTVCVHLADTTIAVICDIKIAGIVYCDVPGAIQRGFDGKAVIASITGGAITSNGGDDTPLYLLCGYDY